MSNTTTEQTEQTYTFAGETFSLADIIGACRRTIAHKASMAEYCDRKGDAAMARSYRADEATVRAQLAELEARQAAGAL